MTVATICEKMKVADKNTERDTHTLEAEGWGDEWMRLLGLIDEAIIKETTMVASACM